ncbi:MAG TPA: aminopeptidase P family protein [Chitinophagaceae bacterium]|nr:aminopeptidase P family protein [Chitinophagaceae bacterium]
MRSFLFSFYLLFVVSVNAQENLPKDYLGADFHKGRRDELRKRMPENSVVVLFAYPERVFSRDVSYVYHPNPDLYYFSGYKEPESMLLIFKEEQKMGERSFNEVFFVRQRNPMEEVWTGRRLGVEGVKKLGFSEVYNSGEFKNFSLDLSKLNVIYDRMPDDVGAGMLSNLMKSLKEKANVKEPGSRSLSGAYMLIRNSTNPSNLSRRVNQLKGMIANSGDDALKNDPLVSQLLNSPDSATLVAVQEKLKIYNFPADDYNKLVAGLREIKTPEELSLLRKSAFLSAVAHEEVMKAIQPNMSESEIHGLFLYVHKKYGAEDEGYPPIVGAGGNGCILHYTENNATKLDNQLVLMDVGSEYHGYSADVTRTVPANGKFTTEQKAIYDLVYKAQEEVFKICKEGTPFRDLNVKTSEVLAEGLMKLGIIKQKSEVSQYYMHGVSHHLGLDVHDKWITPTLKENMVITVEPGIYIPKGSPCDKKWWDIGVRIEDDIIIGKNSCENISAYAPRKSEDVEKATAKKSVVNDMVLPKLK